ncbi:sugar transferase [uncultured Sphingomonas sp.]|uniref:sugar transferase n=1 Tax=uncultured Sphingomonas sp. TaxID=158754 RepID=UPI0035CA85F8
MSEVADGLHDEGPGVSDREARMIDFSPTARSSKARRTIWRPSSSTLRVRAFSYQMIFDIAAILAGFAAAASFRRSFIVDTNWLIFALVLLPTYIVVALNFDAYASGEVQDPFRSVRRGAQAFLSSVAFLILIAFYARSSDTFQRLTIAVGSIFALVLIAVARYSFARHMVAIIGGNPFSVVLINDRDQPVPPGCYSLVMTAGADLDPDHHDPVMYDRLATALAPADRVVVCCPADRREAWARLLRGAHIQGEIAIPELATLSPLGLGPDRANPSVIVATGPLNLFDRSVKRLFDVVVALIGLLLTSPILIGTALWVKLDSAGPVFFRQVRIGRGNQMFRMLKFRSMRDKSSDGHGGRSTARDDDRITRCGAFIRRTSIDELPQLLNVLRGEMSIVGPRPHALGSRAADKLFWEVDRRYWDRHATKPGLTGLAQIRGFRGATVLEDDLRNRLQADLEYLEKWSIWRDMKIIFLTARVLLHRNAF